MNEFGLVLQFTECLQYISDDPEGLFFDADEQHGAVPWGAISQFAAAVCLFHRNIFSCAVLGGTAGGMASGTGLGGIYGILAGMLLSMVPVLLRGSFREALARVILVGIPGSAGRGCRWCARWGRERLHFPWCWGTDRWPCDWRLRGEPTCRAGEGGTSLGGWIHGPG